MNVYPLRWTARSSSGRGVAVAPLRPFRRSGEADRRDTWAVKVGLSPLRPALSCCRRSTGATPEDVDGKGAPVSLSMNARASDSVLNFLCLALRSVSPRSRSDDQPDLLRMTPDLPFALVPGQVDAWPCADRDGVEPRLGPDSR